MPLQTREIRQQSESVGKEKRKPVRRDPEKRRQQNIRAQRKYREKLRERLAYLEALAASAAQSDAIERTSTAGTGQSEAVTTHGSSSTPTHILPKTPPSYDASDISVSSLSTVTLGEYQRFIPHSDDTLSSLTIWDSTPHFLLSDDMSSAPSLWDSPTHVDPSHLILDKQNDSLGPYWTTTIDCGCPSPHFQIQTHGSDPFRYGEVRVLKFKPSATAADPYANNLRIEKVCTITALYALGMHVGITEEMICADESFSPFFRSITESTDDMIKANTIGTVQRIFKTLKPDLRPSSEQITIQHHPYIDILPFPTLRKNLITHQEEIDEDEFFLDILTGLVCWGGAGIGRKDREDSTGYASTGTPWDVRSWEARVWFLKKYWTLLGGEDGELVRQSEWWRSIRGDDTLNTEVHS
ncbi:hypothetical protein CPC735_015200 [Coccidioides posadasii C735 delta SOWgp]|uniref:BZIP domain-containing protein n=1 Tax=Coccidioides posadasii (strain C735) TaxID=222929 RepID=C5PCW1_COCP7|nr:hypothetical protein CPC735_015200 [Coccidioides posadasii C735 delta SOWgp]EER24922.1 hypothetical protein CPC735_015200 [Coccidioides posadasii C735 delta SOWgp]|eukprot:XP_003067067.1 hypothetical protein CPC735_015200 [Coccidioides posadasii C735 delta SOWgp]